MGRLLSTALPVVVLLAMTFSACSVGAGRNAIRDDIPLEQQLFDAADSGNAKLVKALLARGANPNAVVKVTPIPNGSTWNDTPYIAAACAVGFVPEVFDLIVAAGGDMNTKRSPSYELPPPFQGCRDYFGTGSNGNKSSPGRLLGQMMKNGFVLPPPEKISEYLVLRYAGMLDSPTAKDIIPVLPPDVAAAVIQDGRAKMAAEKQRRDEDTARRLAEQKRRSDEEYAKASPEWRKVLDEQKRIIRAHDQGLTGATAQPLAPPPKAVGDMVCRKGRLQYQTCTNPSYSQSCVTVGVPGVMYGWAEGFSADHSRVQIRSGGVEISGTVRYPIHSQVTLEGVGAGKGDVFWDTTTNWYVCHRVN